MVISNSLFSMYFNISCKCFLSKLHEKKGLILALLHPNVDCLNYYSDSCWYSELAAVARHQAKKYGRPDWFQLLWRTLKSTVHLLWNKHTWKTATGLWENKEKDEGEKYPEILEQLKNNTKNYKKYRGSECNVHCTERKQIGEGRVYPNKRYYTSINN